MTSKKQFYKLMYRSSLSFDYCDEDVFYTFFIPKFRKIISYMNKRVRANLLQEMDEEMMELNGTDIWWRYNAVASILWFYGWQKFIKFKKGD